jgi:hypothetical protein
MDENEIRDLYQILNNVAKNNIEADPNTEHQDNMYLDFGAYSIIDIKISNLILEILDFKERIEKDKNNILDCIHYLKEDPHNYENLTIEINEKLNPVQK